MLQGEVVRCEAFGAFVALPSGLEGLVHVSEMGAKRRINHARDAVSIGDSCTAFSVLDDNADTLLGLLPSF